MSGNLDAVCRVADDEEQEGAFVAGAIQNLVEEAHGAGGVGEADQPGMVQGGDEDAGGDADAFLYVVMFDFAAVGEQAVALGEDGDESGGRFQEWFLVVGSQGSQGVEPFLGSFAVVEVALFFFRGRTNPLLHLTICHHHKMPGLQVGPIGSRTRRQQAILDDPRRQGAVGKLPYRAPPTDVSIERGRALLHLFG